MKITELIAHLQRTREKHGNIEVTCTGCHSPETDKGYDGSPYETTVENLVIGEREPFGKKVRLYW